VARHQKQQDSKQNKSRLAHKIAQDHSGAKSHQLNSTANQPQLQTV